MKTYSRLFEQIVSLLLVSYLLAGCAAIQPPIGPNDVLSVGAGQVVYGLRQAVASKPGTALMSDPSGQFFLAAWPCAGGSQCWAFIARSCEEWYANGGNISNVKTWEEVKAALDALKWAPVMPGTLLTVLGEKAVAVISRVMAVPILIMPEMLDPMQVINPQEGV